MTVRCRLGERRINYARGKSLGIITYTLSEKIKKKSKRIKEIMSVIKKSNKSKNMTYRFFQVIYPSDIYSIININSALGLSNRLPFFHKHQKLQRFGHLYCVVHITVRVINYLLINRFHAALDVSIPRRKQTEQRTYKDNKCKGRTLFSFKYITSSFQIYTDGVLLNIAHC